ncbi:hypothetical protein ACFL27_18795 [candidate division CSSED10-310 bacterium]|uniref:Peptidase M6-like domain-containing protein n=1 Tax=candidate division CSSED10-310 bacterium TaxID=2855610 RepID=A0ABV6Z1B3_UNCC1
MICRFTTSSLVVLIAISSCMFIACTDDDDDGATATPTPTPSTATSFWAASVSTGEYYQLTANLIGEGEHCKIYLEVGADSAVEITDELIANISTAFTQIYQLDRSCFGEEPNPGIDGDPKIIILLLDIKDDYDPPSNTSYTAGYFSWIDLLTEEQLQSLGVDAKTNKKEMFYMDVFPGEVGSDVFMRAFPHEFQHMINFYQKTFLPYQNTGSGSFEATWLNEAMSEVAETVCGYGPYYGFVYLYLEQPDAAGLTEWSNALHDFAIGLMWASYLYDRWGTAVIRDMVTLPEDGLPRYGIDAVEYSIQKNNLSAEGIDTFERLYTAWNFTVLLESLQLDIPPYQYTSIELFGTHDDFPLNGVTMIIDQSNAGQLGSYASRYFSFTNPGSVSFTPANASASAFFDGGDAHSLVWHMESGQWYAAGTMGYAVARNPNSTHISDSGSYSWTNTGYQSRIPHYLPPDRHLTQKEATDVIHAITGKPVPIDVDWIFMEQLREALDSKKVKQEQGFPK